MRPASFGDHLLNGSTSFRWAWSGYVTPDLISSHSSLPSRSRDRSEKECLINAPTRKRFIFEFSYGI